jgi:predicted ArsR family transcriptional regulator
MTDPIDVPRDPLAQLALLSEPVRRRVYELAAASGPIDRDTAAAGVGISRSLAAFHLDRLAEVGLLEASYRRRSGRSGPGAGRPAKFYRRPAGASVEVTLPPRRYELAARLFAAGIDRTTDGRDATLAAARDAGREAGETIPARVRSGPRAGARRALLGLLVERGFEPRDAADGGIELGNCPYRDLTAAHRDLTCGANLALVSSLTESIGGAGLVADRRDPAEPCCVSLRRAGPADTLAGGPPQHGA